MEFASDGFNLRRTIQTKNTIKPLYILSTDLFTAFDPKQCHQYPGYEHCTQAVKGGSESIVNFQSGCKISILLFEGGMSGSQVRQPG